MGGEARAGPHPPSSPQRPKPNTRPAAALPTEALARMRRGAVCFLGERQPSRISVWWGRWGFQPWPGHLPAV